MPDHDRPIEVQSTHDRERIGNDVLETILRRGLGAFTVAPLIVRDDPEPVRQFGDDEVEDPRGRREPVEEQHIATPSARVMHGEPYTVALHDQTSIVSAMLQARTQADIDRLTTEPMASPTRAPTTASPG